MTTLATRRGGRPPITDCQRITVFITPAHKRYLKLRGFGNMSKGVRYLIDACLESDAVVVGKEEYKELRK